MTYASFPRPRGRSLGKSAFTLVEITLALGIVSFVIVSMMGVMSVGLTTIKDASDNTMHAQILAQVSSTAQQTPFARIESLNTASDPLMFDQSGRETTIAQNSLYQASMEVVSGSTSTYPGAPSTLNSSAKAVKIKVTTKPPGATAPLSTSYATIIVPQS